MTAGPLVLYLEASKKEPPKMKGNRGDNKSDQNAGVQPQ